MAKFKITTDDGTFLVEADSPETATAALEQHSQRNYTGETDASGVPEGMVYDKATNRMVDAKALADQAIPGGSRPASWVKGVPFIGEYADEVAGAVSGTLPTWLGGNNPDDPNQTPEITTQMMREAAKTYEKDHPNEALAGKLAVGLTTLPAAVEFTPAALANGSLLARTAKATATGATLGATEGAVSGYGEGEGDDRLDSAKERAQWSGIIGGLLGAATPAATDGAKAAVKWVKDGRTVDKQIEALGIKRPAADTVTAAMRADDTLGPVGVRRLAKAGDDAMLVDAGPTAAGVLDTTIQKGNLAGRIAQKAVQERAAKASQKLKGTLDLVLGKPPGIDKAAQDIASKSSAARKAAYDLAYSKPIDYATEAGRQVEDVFQRTPRSILKAAVDEANDAMKIDRRVNMQIMANIADDGTVTFRQMPNVMQVDYLKRALNEVANANVDQYGRKTAAGLRAAQLARELRDAAVESVGEYKAAIKLGGDKIEEDNALRLGYELLRPSTTREDVAAAVKGITDPERKQLALGLRQQIDDTMANVTQALSDPNVDAREAAKALKDLSSRSAREKLVTALGERYAKPILHQLDEAQAAISLKADVVTNSKTFARTETAKAVDQRNPDSVWQNIKEVAPLKAVKAAGRKFTGSDEASRLSREEAVYADIAKLLTGTRGRDAQLALQRLEAAYKAGDLNAEKARQISQAIVGGADVTAYQFATR